VILPPVRDPRFVTIRRGGTLTDDAHRLLALWAATCAEHVLAVFEAVRPADLRPREAIEAIRAWTRGEITMTQSRSAGGHAMGAARDLRGAARHAAYAAGQVGVRLLTRLPQNADNAHYVTSVGKPGRTPPRSGARCEPSSQVDAIAGEALG